MLIKIGVETIPPFTLTALRLSLAALLFLIYLLFKRQWIPMHSQAILLYVGSGLLGNSLPFALISLGETHISSSLTAILMGIMPIATFVLAHLFVAEEPMTRRKVIGITFGFCGLLVLVGVTAFTNLDGQLPGQLMVLGGALCYAAATVFVRLQPSFERYKMAAGTTIFAAIPSIILAFVFENPTEVSASNQSLYAVITLAVFPTAIAALIYFRIIKTLGATIFSQINYVIPVLGGLWGVIVLGETLGWNVFAALGLVLFGIYLIQSKSAG